MEGSPLEQHIFAYYLTNGARDLTMVPRYWPRGELVLIVEDKIKFATYQFGSKIGPACPAVARNLLDVLIARGGFSSVDNNFGGTMHQYQPETYQQAIDALQAENPILREAEAGGAGFWEQRFAELTNA